MNIDWSAIGNLLRASSELHVNQQLYGRSLGFTPAAAADNAGEQISFKKPLPPQRRMQDEPEDLSLPPAERTSRVNFWTFVEGKKRSGEIVLACSSCLLVFSDPLLYRMHVGTHVWGRPFQCVACGTVCHDRVAFQRHLIGARHG